MTSKVCSCKALHAQSAPKVWCQLENNHSSALSSMASAVHHMGFKAEAQELKDLCGSERCDPIKNLKKAMKRSGTKGKSNLYRPFVEEYGPEQFDPLAITIPVKDPVLLVPCGSTGNVGHTVTLYGHWIFDSAEKVALPICRESLNRCCGGCEHIFTLGAYKFSNRRIQDL